MHNNLSPLALAIRDYFISLNLGVAFVEYRGDEIVIDGVIDLEGMAKAILGNTFAIVHKTRMQSAEYGLVLPSTLGDGFERDEGVRVTAAIGAAEALFKAGAFTFTFGPLDLNHGTREVTARLDALMPKEPTP